MENKSYRVSVITLGCRANQYESNAIVTALEDDGITFVDPGEKCDVAIINTCTVTAESDRKSRQMIRRAKSSADHVIVTGCFAEISPDEASAIDGVDLVIGNKNKSTVIRAVRELRDGTLNPDNYTADRFESPSALSGISVKRARAYIKIEDGCENKCAYCIIPKARGPVRSKMPSDVIAEACALAKAGVKEVILTGIETASYGKDLDGDYSLIDLLEDVSEIDGIERIALGSLDPSSMRGDFPTRIAKLPKVIHHFHLSLQSGCSDTLRAMRRRYNASQASQFIENVREVIPDATLSADIIAGFPGESDADFEESLRFLEKAKLLHIHAFPYSVREGTEAAGMAQVADQVKKERTARLAALDRRVRGEYLDGYVEDHREVPVHVLCEKVTKGVGVGHTEHFVEVRFPCAADAVGVMCGVLLDSSDGECCFGRKREYCIKQIGSDEYSNCGVIWNMRKFPHTDSIKSQIAAGIRDVYILSADGQYIAECDLVYDDPEYNTVPGKRLYLPRLVVKKDHRGERYGKTILQYVLSLVKEKGYSEIVLGVNCDNTVALNLYNKLGFTVYETDEDSDGQFYRMIKML